MNTPSNDKDKGNDKDKHKDKTYFISGVDTVLRKCRLKKTELNFTVKYPTRCTI